MTLRLNSYSSRGLQARIFLTCWLIFVLHFATNFVREHYLVVSIVDDFSFRLDPYADMHVDIFETPEHGAHHGANPGTSMVAALPYLLFKPAVDWIVDREIAARAQEEDVSAEYRDDRPARQKFYRQARERGLDIKFGLVGIITMVFCMAPLSAATAVVMFRLLGKLQFSTKMALGLTFLYAFGTPILFRTHYLNQNLMLGLFAFMAFALLWQPGADAPPKKPGRYVLAGLLGGMAFLCDYSGLPVMLILGAYVLMLHWKQATWREAAKNAGWFAAGAVGPVLLLWFYQWQSFGHPFYPPQHYMPPVQWIDVGYQGVGLPSPELIGLLLFDPRYGLFTSSPLMLVAFVAPVLHYLGKIRLPLRETLFIFAFFVGFTLFLGCIQYTRLQFITGIRYIVPLIPFLFIPAAYALVRLPRWLAYLIVLVSLTVSWCISMVSDDKIQVGILEAIKTIFTQGFQLPWLNTLFKMSAQYAPDLATTGVSPLPIFVLSAFIIYGMWRLPLPWEKTVNA